MKVINGKRVFVIEVMTKVVRIELGREENFSLI